MTQTIREEFDNNSFILSTNTVISSKMASHWAEYKYAENGVRSKIKRESEKLHIFHLQQKKLKRLQTRIHYLNDDSNARRCAGSWVCSVKFNASEFILGNCHSVENECSLLNENRSLTHAIEHECLFGTFSGGFNTMELLTF